MVVHVFDFPKVEMRQEDWRAHSCFRGDMLFLARMSTRHALAEYVVHIAEHAIRETTNEPRAGCFVLDTIDAGRSQNAQKCAQEAIQVHAV